MSAQALKAQLEALIQEQGPYIPVYVKIGDAEYLIKSCEDGCSIENASSDLPKRFICEVAE